MLREQPNAVQGMVEAIAAGIHCFKTNKEESIKNYEQVYSRR
jgi:hypothetical protein